MKFNRYFLLLMSAVFAMSHSGFCQNGTGSHGGDTLVFEFTGSANNLQKALATLGSRVDYPTSCPEPTRFQQLILDTQYSSAPVVFVEKEQDGKNWIDSNGKHIEISRTRIPQINDPTLMMILVLHEYLGLEGKETTNDLKHSKVCIDYVRSMGFLTKDLVYRVNAITTIEQRFSEAKLSFLCVDADGASFRIRLMDKYACNPDSKSLVVERLESQASWKQVVRSGCRTMNDWRDAFFLNYSVNSGEGSYQLEMDSLLSEFNGVRAISLASSDHSHWTFNLSFLEAHRSPIQAQCAPELKLSSESTCRPRVALAHCT